MTVSKKRSWSIDQLAKSEFFHQKLHEWELLEAAEKIEDIKGESLNWNRSRLAISDKAWNKVIHRGIKPITVFAHPDVLVNVSRSTGYYRMLAMVSQKSMNQVGLSTMRYEKGKLPKPATAEIIAQHLNNIISKLIEAGEKIDAREFDLWRGMAAGSQAQGSWQNTKGRKMEIVLQGIIRRRLRESGLVAEEIDDKPRMTLTDHRVVVFADEPDIGFYQDDKIVATIEVKGGIDKAGVLERVGAAIKSLSRSKEENPDSVTILILQEVSMTPQSVIDLQTNQKNVNHWFTMEDVLESEEKRGEIFALLRI
ncbi:MAG: XcyI family restriction endonuclease [Ardenticatenales bacterium]|nr:XcyI family restriction endonuclease [Ardenticatenales bacterium]